MLENQGHASGPTPQSAVQDREELERRGAELARLHERLRDLDRFRTEILTEVSREFAAHIKLLLASLEGLLASPPPAEPERRTLLDVARRNALDLRKLGDKLKDSSGLEYAIAGADREPTDLAAFTAELAGQFRPACEWAGLSLVVDCPPLPAQVSVNRDMWEKIVVNLVANAFKLTVKGSIEVRLRMQDDYACLSVRDSGTGIAKSDLPYIFGRSHPATVAQAGASDDFGTGLKLISELVQQHNGSIEVQSEPGSGSTFTVLLPLGAEDTTHQHGSGIGGERAPAAAAPRARALALEALPRSTGAATRPVSTTGTQAVARGRIVIAEDNADFRAYLRHLLEGAGFEVDAHSDGAAALAACMTQAPDALISDVSMPGLDGFRLIERLRADENTALMPVLLLSGRANEDERIAGIAAGADEYLVKPLGGRELVARVEGAVRLARLRRETARREQADFESLFSMAPDGIIVVSPEGKVLTANERAQKLFGYSEQEFQGLQIEALIPAKFRQAHVEHRKAHLRTPSPRLSGINRELPASRRDGSEFIAEIGLAPLHFKNQACTVANVRDVTERRQLEAERAEHEKRFRELSRSLMEVQEAERRKLSTELHDRSSPGLAAIQINLQMLGNLLRPNATEDLVALLDDTAGLIADTTVSIREISSNLRPTVLDDGGLLPALAGYAQEFMQRTGIAVDLQTAEAAGALSAAVQSGLFRIIQEGLTNCAKHSKASRVTIRLGVEGNLATLTIADDGAGFDLARRGPSGLGLLTMRERAEFTGGAFTIDSAPGQGTRIQVLVPAHNSGTARN
ncbi:MAG: response regulator [Burkholderiales bacterium]|nr:response regulator [Burkholderiales bacterium]